MNAQPATICTEPYFAFDHQHGHYRACSQCGRIAWEHAQSNPIADVANMAEWYFNGAQGQPPAPVMRP